MKVQVPLGAFFVSKIAEVGSIVSFLVIPDSVFSAIQIVFLVVDGASRDPHVFSGSC